MRDAAEVARRCVALELLLQRLGLETDTDEPAEERDRVRAMWRSRVPDLGLEDELSPAERAHLERKVGELSDDDLDDLHGRVVGALVLLWALGRLPTRPASAEVDGMEELLAVHGVLGGGSIKAANATIAGATLRPESELEAACSHYERVRGKAREPSSADAIFGGVGAHHLGWVLDPEMDFEID
jgi:hypothetical protein